MLDKGNSDQSNKTVMTLKEQKNQANEFVARWKDRGNERQDSQPFWLDLLQSVYGIEKPTEYITFEDKVMQIGRAHVCSHLVEVVRSRMPSSA